MADEKAERKKMADERKKLKKDQAAQRKEAKKRAKELADQEAELDGETTGGGISMFFVTIFIILIMLNMLLMHLKCMQTGICLSQSRKKSFLKN